MKEIVISIGHGENTYRDKKSKGVVVSGKVYEEHSFNALVGMRVKAIVEAHGVKVHLVQQPNAKDVPLTTRTNIANSLPIDLYWSIHANAGGAEGVAAFYWSTSKDGEKAANLYAKFAKEEGFKTYSDGSYPSVEGTWNDFHELRKTKAVAILTENGFMDNPTDFKGIFLNEGDYHNRISRVNAKAILAYLNIKYDPSKDLTVKKAEVKKPVTRQVKVVLETNNVNAAKIIKEFKERGYTARMEEL